MLRPLKAGATPAVISAARPAIGSLSAWLAIGLAIAVPITMPTAALAHPGHGLADSLTHSAVSLPTALGQGLFHPAGADHLLAMLAVGVWATAALPASRRLLAPACFVLAMMAGAVAGATGLMAGSELLIAATVAMFGLMLVFAQRLPTAAGLVLTATAGVLHGIAHGVEAPVTGLGGGLTMTLLTYGLGFVLATSLLHGAGLWLGSRLQALHRRATAWLGSALGASGLWLALVS